MKRIISYIFPVTKKVNSEINGSLEITLVNGKKVLDTEHANYSFGSLQRVLKFALQQVELKEMNHILVLGLGGGSVLETLPKDFNYSNKITAIDIDPVVIDIAAHEFGINSDEQTRISCNDAFEFVKEHGTKYDLIIVDLFIDNKIPEKFLLIDFWKEMLQNVNIHGSVIFNSLCFPPSDLLPIKAKLKKRGFEFEVFRYVEKTNKVIVASLQA